MLVLLPSHRKPAEEPEEPQSASVDAGEDSASTADVKDPTEYQQIFKSNSKLGEKMRLDDKQHWDVAWPDCAFCY